MNLERIVASLAGAQALLDQAMEMLAEKERECDHPIAQATEVSRNQDKHRTYTCGVCSERFSRPWEED